MFSFLKNIYICNMGYCAKMDKTDFTIMYAGSQSVVVVVYSICGLFQCIAIC